MGFFKKDRLPTMEEINAKYERVAEGITKDCRSLEAAKAKYPDAERILQETFLLFRIFQVVNDGLDRLEKQIEHYQNDKGDV
ncbi:hypothetical protein [Bacillus sp. SG-1]|uniref:hypothetical protein n=1 Tax=Bacillus sp. SG-1 TaxID=161544 RepID=UPI0001543E81|nr:hypothetical protein [Bacillus sp. SG-1]EDL64996.1 hypothetical protein BSG1_14784 [Bacillus sp. SG-1]